MQHRIPIMLGAGTHRRDAFIFMLHDTASVQLPGLGLCRLCRAATAAVVVHMLATRGLSKRTLSVAAIIVLTAASQDILALQNKGTLKQMLHSSQVQSVVQPLSQYGLLPKVLVVQQQQEAAPHIQQLRLLVRGMKCEGCAHHLKGRIEAVPGVSAVSIDFSSKQVNVTLVAGMDQRTILEAVQAVDERYVPEVVQ